MSDWTRQFSLPDRAADESVFDTMVTAHGAAIASWLLDKHGEDVARASDGLVEFIRGWIGNGGASLVAWDISFGRAHLALKEGKLDPVEAAVKVGLRISNSGYPGRWWARMPITSVQLDNMAVEDVSHVDVKGDPAQSTIKFQLVDGAKVELRRDGEGPWTQEGGGCSKLESVGKNRVIYLLSRRALPPDDRGGEIFRECQPVGTITFEMAKSFNDGFDVLEKNAPQYVPWVERVLNGIVVCRTQAEYRLVSGSWEDVPGFVHMSSPHDGIDIAEILVHECAHQYFYMLQRVGPVDDSTDRELYWSPPIRKKRPLSRILMAYHALANVQILYEAVRSNEANERRDIEYVRVNEPDLQAAIKALDEPLRDNTALTKLGRGLYQPLADRMRALAVAV